MIGTIGSILLTTYILMVVAMLAMFLIARHHIGGFEKYAAAVNEAMGTNALTETSVQWYIVGIILFWPVVLIMLASVMRRARQVD